MGIVKSLRLWYNIATMKRFPRSIPSNIPTKGGFSELRIRFIVLVAIFAILITTPFIGFINSVLSVLLVASFGVIVTVKVKENDLGYRLEHQLSMDKMYNNSADRKHILYRLNKYYLRHPGQKPVLRQKAAVHVSAPSQLGKSVLSSEAC